ncbi:hypothetical protein GCM10022254_19080 [Actinomadura meridiana]|uniref:Ferric siderophore reductase C-terminal domain-containing protein n=1 Tax=Actinomadura meridiana TaxID=559626 RepID=A0ABP8BWK9_9ACTN
MAVDVGHREVAEVLGEAARLGPYFEIVTGVQADGAGWSAFPGEVGKLDALSGDYAERLGTGEARVASSLLFQGLAARLWSPVVASAALGVVPDLGELRWRGLPGEPIVLGVVEPRGWRVNDAVGAAERVYSVVVDGQLRRLRELTAGLAEGLAWGNAASALVGSLNVGPDDLARRAIVRELLGREPLEATGVWGTHGYVRRSCCLYYRVPGGGMCGDCCLRPEM